MSIVTSNLFGFESKKLVFQALQQSEGEETLDRGKAKNLFDRMDIVLGMETAGECKGKRWLRTST
jgi:hypothetical protein